MDLSILKLLILFYSTIQTFLTDIYKLCPKCFNNKKYEVIFKKDKKLINPISNLNNESIKFIYDTKISCNVNNPLMMTHFYDYKILPEINLSNNKKIIDNEYVSKPNENSIKSSLYVFKYDNLPEWLNEFILSNLMLHTFKNDTNCGQCSNYKIYNCQLTYQI